MQCIYTTCCGACLPSEGNIRVGQNERSGYSEHFFEIRENKTDQFTRSVFTTCCFTKYSPPVLLMISAGGGL